MTISIVPDGTSANSHALVSEIERRTMRKVAWRIVPFLILCYFIAYVDRVNIGFAALTMNADIGLTQTAFGIGGSLFFIAYVLFEVPSNVAMEKFGARVWIARIMITWGLVGIGMAFVTGAYSFYGLRFLLGAAEAGFFPGAVLAQLHALLGDVRQVMSLLAIVTQVLVAAGVLTGLVILTRLYAQRLALLRALPTSASSARCRIGNREERFSLSVQNE